MVEEKKAYEQQITWIGVSILILGILLRLLGFVENRSFFLDEANVARNIAERDFGQFWEALDYHQHAPPILLSLFKVCTEWFGFTEYSLRLIPLIGGGISVFLFYLLLRKQVRSPIAIGFPLLLFCCTPSIIRYASEAKQYSTDVMVTVGILLVAYRTRPLPEKSWNWLLLGLGGALVIWFSMTAIFPLAGLGLYWLALLLDSKMIKKLPWLIGCGGLWIMSFGIYYFTQLQAQIGLDYLQSFHQSYFLNLAPTSWEQLQESGSVIRSIFRTATDKTFLGIGAGVFFFLVGLYTLRKRIPELILLGFPLLALAVASHLNLYAFTPRLALFFMPILWSIMAIGLDTLWPRIPFGKWGDAVFILLLAMLWINQGSWRLFVQGHQVEESRPLLQQLEQRIQSNEDIWVYHQAVPAVEVYRRYHQSSISFEGHNLYYGEWYETPLQRDIVPPFWMVFSHIDPLEEEHILGNIRERYNTKLELEEVGAKAYRVTKKAPDLE